MERFFDAHTHVHFAAFAGETDAVIDRARTARVRMITVGTQLDTSQEAVETARRHPESVWATVGLHPIHTSASYHDDQELGGGDAAKAFTSRGESFDSDAYRELAKDPKTVAIGECGLDYYRLDKETKGKQLAAFEAQFELAREVERPLMIHCREAFPDLIGFLSERRGRLPAEDPGVVHFMSGTIDDARALLELGFSFTFGGVITFPGKKDAPNASEELIRFLPLDRLISETDAPYVAPVPYRGKRNEPMYVVEIAKRLAELKRVSLDELCVTIETNVERVFGIAPLGKNE